MKRIPAIFLILISSLILACGGSSSSSSDQEVANLRVYCESVGLPVKSSQQGNYKIINGEACGSLIISAVVRVAALVTDGVTAQAVPICSGTMISSDDVLTAAHCVESQTFGDLAVLGYGIIVGEPGLATYIPAISGSISPGYSYAFDRLFGDAAILQLETPPGLPVLPVLMSSSAVPGQDGLVYGYGARYEGDEGLEDPELFFDLRSGSMRIENVTPNHIFVIYDGSGTNVCNGDSGGPMVLPVNGVPTVIGVVSQGTTIGCTAGDITTFTNLQDPGVLNWLVESVPDVAVY